jgi:hypothetical protein
MGGGMMGDMRLIGLIGIAVLALVVAARKIRVFHVRRAKSTLPAERATRLICGRLGFPSTYAWHGLSSYDKATGKRDTEILKMPHVGPILKPSYSILARGDRILKIVPCFWTDSPP